MAKPINIKVPAHDIDIHIDDEKIAFYHRKIHFTEQVVRGARQFTLHRKNFSKEAWKTMVGWMEQWTEQ